MFYTEFMTIASLRTPLRVSIAAAYERFWHLHPAWISYADARSQSVRQHRWRTVFTICGVIFNSTLISTGRLLLDFHPRYTPISMNSRQNSSSMLPIYYRCCCGLTSHGTWFIRRIPTNETDFTWLTWLSGIPGKFSTKPEKVTNLKLLEK